MFRVARCGDAAPTGSSEEPGASVAGSRSRGGWHGLVWGSAVAWAMPAPTRASPTDRWLAVKPVLRPSTHALTGRESDVLRLLAEQATFPEMAQRLEVTESTVRHHLRRALTKLNERYATATRGVGGDRLPLAMAGERERVTGLPGHEAGQRLLRRLTAAAAQRDLPLSVALLELEPRGGPREPMRAMIVRGVAHAVAAAARRSDWVGAWDSAVLLVVLPATNLDGARAAADRLRRAAGDEAQCFVGAVEWQPGEEVDLLLARLQRAVQEDRVRREVARNLWIQTSHPG